jgi:transposase InsO family protein
MPNDLLTADQRQRLTWIRLHEPAQRADAPSSDPIQSRDDSQRAASTQCLSARPATLATTRPAALTHQKGKVERSHQTDLLEFYATADLKASDLAEPLDLWQHAYNWDRPHSSLGGKTPIDRVCELAEQTPLHEEVAVLYDQEREPVRHAEYALDVALRKLKRCL